MDDHNGPDDYRHEDDKRHPEDDEAPAVLLPEGPFLGFVHLAIALEGPDRVHWFIFWAMSWRIQVRNYMCGRGDTIKG